jgi:hypothetical protein
MVAFIDLLGFTRHVEDNWGDDEGSALCKLLRIKSSVPTESNQVRLSLYTDLPGDGVTYACRVATVSDSITVSVALCRDAPYRSINWPDYFLAFCAICNNIAQVWRAAIAEGFTLRGAIEAGRIFWSKTELVGPAFNDAYELESKRAGVSRILVGPGISKSFIQCSSAFPKNSGLLSPLPFLAKNQDGKLSLDPGLLARERPRERSELIQRLESMQRACKGVEKARAKYDELLSILRLPDRAKMPTVDDLRRYLQDLEKE